MNRQIQSQRHRHGFVLHLKPLQACSEGTCHLVLIHSYALQLWVVVGLFGRNLTSQNFHNIVVALKS